MTSPRNSYFLFSKESELFILNNQNFFFLMPRTIYLNQHFWNAKFSFFSALLSFPKIHFFGYFLFLLYFWDCCFILNPKINNSLIISPSPKQNLQHIALQQSTSSVNNESPGSDGLALMILNTMSFNYRRWKISALINIFSKKKKKKKVWSIFQFKSILHFCFLLPRKHFPLVWFFLPQQNEMNLLITPKYLI